MRSQRADIKGKISPESGLGYLLRISARAQKKWSNSEKIEIFSRSPDEITLR
jgi:hypothetical protein